MGTLWNIVLALTVAAAAGLSIAPCAHAADKPPKAQSHGALAWDRVHQRFGYAVSRPTARAAAIEALRHCGDGSCEVVLAFKSSCGALARREARIFTASGATRDEAQTKALKRCDGPECEIVGWGCNK